MSTEPIRRSDLPCIPPPEWEIFTWFPHPDGGGDMVRGQRQRGVQVRRRVSYGDWEPVRPDHWVDGLESETRTTTDFPAGESAPGDWLPTDEDFLVALEGALEKRLLPKPGIGVLEDVRGAVMQALGPLVDQLRAEAERQVDAKIGVAGEWGNALADKTAAEATLRAVREYVETSDDDAIRTRETVLRILDDVGD